jgi:signal transduction histidine kinase
MFGSVFRKFLFTYLAILILVMLVLSLTITSLTENFVYDMKKGLLKNVAFKTNALANAMERGDIAKEQLSSEIDTMGYITDTKIYVVRADAGSVKNLRLNEELQGDYLAETMPRILAGETVHIRKQYSQGFEAQMLFAGYPWKDEGGVKGVILLFAPEKEIDAVTGNINGVIWLTAAAFVLIGALVIYLNSKRLSKPIKAIDAASKKLATGEKIEDIPVRGKDEIARLSASFNAMKQKMLENEELRQELIANVSHDLRTPLTTINGFVNGMKEGVIKQEDYAKYLDIISGEAGRLIRMTEGILDSAKARAGRLMLNKAPFMLRDVFKTCLAAVRPAAAEKHIKIEAGYDRDLRANGDFNKIQQALYNIVQNAVKYTPPGGTVAISAKAEGQNLEFCVQDTGEGIPPEELENVLERFYRPAESEGGGYGLGLNIARAYIEAHGGRMSVKSEPGKGTSVTFNIPDA